MWRAHSPPFSEYKTFVMGVFSSSTPPYPTPLSVLLTRVICLFEVTAIKSVSLSNTTPWGITLLCVCTKLGPMFKELRIICLADNLVCKPNQLNSLCFNNRYIIHRMESLSSILSKINSFIVHSVF